MAEFQVGPVDGLAGLQIVQVAAGDSISAALTVDGRIYTWGTFRDSKGVLGHDPRGSLIQEHPTLLDALAGHRIVQIGAGANHLMAISEDGQVWAWGCGEQGQLGRRILERHKTNALRPTNVTPRLGRSKVAVSRVVCGSYHTLLITREGQAFAMGLNNYGQLGTGDFEERINPVQIIAGSQVVDASAGEHHSLALLSTGQVLAFGRADSGQLGIPHSSAPLPSPTLIPGLPPIRAISTGGNHNLAVSATDDALFSWGYGGMHQLGHGPDQDETTPRQINISASSSVAMQIRQVSAGGQHSVILVG